MIFMKEMSTMMRVTIRNGDIGNAQTEGLVVPVDGQICVLGGTVAAKALKASLPEEDRRDLWDYLERDVKKLCPMDHGDARVIPGDGSWGSLVIVAAVPHHANDVIFSRMQFSRILHRSIVHGIKASRESNLASIAMTIIADSYRLPSDIAIRSMVVGLHECRREDITVEWCILDREKFDMAREVSQQFHLPYESA